MIPKLILNSAAKLSSGIIPSEATSPVICITPIGPANSALTSPVIICLRPVIILSMIIPVFLAAAINASSVSRYWCSITGCTPIKYLFVLGSHSAVTIVASSTPSRVNAISISACFASRTASTTPCQSWTNLPSTSTIRSPASSPAMTAGLLSIISPRTGSFDGRLIPDDMITMKNNNTGRMKFITEPATMTNIRAHNGFEE